MRDVWILVHAIVVIIVDEAVPDRLAEHQPDRQQQQRTNAQRQVTGRRFAAACGKLVALPKALVLQGRGIRRVPRCPGSHGPGSQWDDVAAGNFWCKGLPAS